MFIEIKNRDNDVLDALINLDYVQSIKVVDCGPLHQIEAYFPNNCTLLRKLGLANDRERISILKEPSTKRFAEIKLKEIKAANPTYERCRQDYNGKWFDLDHIASVVKWRESNQYQVVANFAFEKQSGSNPRCITLSSRYAEESEADKCLSFFAHCVSAIEPKQY